MVVYETSRRLLKQLNSRWIFGRYPLLHAIVFLIQITMLSIVVRKYNSYFQARPVLTTMMTNAVLGGIADTVAQTLTAIRIRQKQRELTRQNDPESLRDDFMTIEIKELDRKVPWPENDYMNPNRVKPPPFDFERTVRFMAYPFIMGPVQFKWFAMLDVLFPKKSGMPGVFKRTALDQFIFAPIGLACFFTFMTVAEGGGRRAITKKFQDVYIPALKANFLVWPAVQMINFTFVPLQFQIPFVSTVGIFWTAYLSLTNAADEVAPTPS